MTHRSCASGLVLAFVVTAGACQRPLVSPDAGGGNGGSAGRMACASFEQNWAARVPSDALILLDASGSMNDDANNTVCAGGCGAASKWAQATTALEALVARTESTVNWGLKLFADIDATCGVSNGAAVPTAPANGAAVAAAIAGRTSANGGVSNGSRTPTRLAIQAATRILAAVDDNHPKLILLVTDGLPNCTPGISDPAADDSAATLQAVMDARAMGISTIVVGIATAGGAADSTLGDIAVAGGYPRTGTTPAYTPLAMIDELGASLTLLGSSGTHACVFTVPAASANTAWPPIGVRTPEGTIPLDTSHQNGWDWTDGPGSAVQVFGPVCDEIQSGRIQSLTIELYCTDTT